MDNAAVSNSVPEESGEDSPGSSALQEGEHSPEVEPIARSDSSEKESLPEQIAVGPVERMEPGTITTENGSGVPNRDSQGSIDGDEPMDSLRRSSRQRGPTRRLTYPELGNPLVTVVQALFQSLSMAITKSFVEPSFTPLPEPEIV